MQHVNPHDQLLDHRARLERAQLEASERRTQALIDQRSPIHSHDTRVRTWERLHQVRLPKSPEHAVLRTVAEQTGLTLADIHEVQRARAQPHPV